MYGLALGRAGAEQPNSIQNAALGILRRYGSDAHVYLPGANGVAVSGLPTNNYTLSNGSTGYSAVDGTAGLVLDGAGSVVQYNPSTVPTGSYEGTGASTVVRTGAGLIFTSAPSGDGIQLNPIYGVSDTFSFVKFTASGSGSLVVFAGGSPVTFTLTGTPTQYQCGTVGNASSWLIFRSNSAGMSASITINEISGSSGIHASQSTTANKPAVRRGLYNLLTYSNDLSNAVWTPEYTASKSGSNILTPAVGDDVYHGTTVAAGSYTLAAQLSGSGTCSLFAYNATNGIHGVTQITLTNTPTIFVAGITSTVANTFYYIGRRTGGTATSITFGGAGLFAGTLTAAQILAEGGIPLTTSAAASNPSAGRYWHQYGGTHSMNFSAVPFQQADDHVVVVAIRPTATGGTTNVFDVSNSGLANPLCARIVLSAGVMYAQWRDDAGTLVSLTGPSFTAGEAFVVTARSVGGVRTIRKNGVVAATSSSALGATTLNQAIFGAAYTGASGTIAPIKGALSDADVLTIERLCAANTPNGPSF